MNYNNTEHHVIKIKGITLKLAKWQTEPFTKNILRQLNEELTVVVSGKDERTKKKSDDNVPDLSYIANYVECTTENENTIYSTTHTVNLPEEDFFIDFEPNLDSASDESAKENVENELRKMFESDSEKEGPIKPVKTSSIYKKQCKKKRRHREQIIRLFGTSLTDVEIPLPTPSTDAEIPLPTPSTDVEIPLPTPLTDVEIPLPTPLTDVEISLPTPLTDVEIPLPTPKKIDLNRRRSLPVSIPIPDTNFLTPVKINNKRKSEPDIPMSVPCKVQKTVKNLNIGVPRTVNTTDYTVSQLTLPPIYKEKGIKKVVKNYCNQEVKIIDEPINIMEDSVIIANVIDLTCDDSNDYSNEFEEIHLEIKPDMTRPGEQPSMPSLSPLGLTSQVSHSEENLDPSQLTLLETTPVQDIEEKDKSPQDNLSQSMSTQVVEENISSSQSTVSQVVETNLASSQCMLTKAVEKNQSTVSQNTPIRAIETNLPSSQSTSKQTQTTDSRSIPLQAMEKTFNTPQTDLPRCTFTQSTVTQVVEKNFCPPQPLFSKLSNPIQPGEKSSLTLSSTSVKSVESQQTRRQSVEKNLELSQSTLLQAELVRHAFSHPTPIRVMEKNSQPIQTVDKSGTILQSTSVESVKQQPIPRQSIGKNFGLSQPTNLQSTPLEAMEKTFSTPQPNLSQSTSFQTVGKNSDLPQCTFYYSTPLRGVEKNSGSLQSTPLQAPTPMQTLEKSQTTPVENNFGQSHSTPRQSVGRIFNPSLQAMGQNTAVISTEKIFVPPIQTVEKILVPPQPPQPTPTPALEQILRRPKLNVLQSTTTNAFSTWRQDKTMPTEPQISRPETAAPPHVQNNQSIFSKPNSVLVAQSTPIQNTTNTFRPQMPASQLRSVEDLHFQQEMNENLRMIQQRQTAEQLPSTNSNLPALSRLTNFCCSRIIPNTFCAEKIFSYLYKFFVIRKNLRPVVDHNHKMLSLQEFNQNLIFINTYLESTTLSFGKGFLNELNNIIDVQGFHLGTILHFVSQKMAAVQFESRVVPLCYIIHNMIIHHEGTCLSPFSKKFFNAVKCTVNRLEELSNEVFTREQLNILENQIHQYHSGQNWLKSRNIRSNNSLNRRSKSPKNPPPHKKARKNESVIQKDQIGGILPRIDNVVVSSAQNLPPSYSSLVTSANLKDPPPYSIPNVPSSSGPSRRGPKPKEKRQPISVITKHPNVVVSTNGSCSQETNLTISPPTNDLFSRPQEMSLTNPTPTSGLSSRPQEISLTNPTPTGGLSSRPQEISLTSSTPTGGLFSRPQETNLTNPPPASDLFSRPQEISLTSPTPTGGLSSRPQETSLMSPTPTGGLSSRPQEMSLTSSTPTGGLFSRPQETSNVSVPCETSTVVSTNSERISVLRNIRIPPRENAEIEVPDLSNVQLNQTKETVPCEEAEKEVDEESEDDVIDLTWIDVDQNEIIEEIRECKEFLLKIETTKDEEREAVADREVISPADSGLGSPVQSDDSFTCICGNRAIYVCACNTATYCSRECQEKNWVYHQQLCSKMMP